MADSKKPVANRPTSAQKFGRMPTRSKPSKQLAAMLKSSGNSTRVQTGTVSAVRWDGTVNITLGGQRYIGIACAQSYADRKPGDRVQVVTHGGMPFVLGAVGGDPDAIAPEIYPTATEQYTWARNGSLSQDIKMFVNSDSDQRVGRLGTKNPVYGPTDQYYQAAYSYWDGAANIMNDPADTVQQIDFFVARSDWDDGDDGPAFLTLWPHKSDALPADPTNLGFVTGLDQLSINFTLEAGELKIITLPDDWRDNIGAASLDANSIRGFVIRPQTTSSGTDPVDNSYAMLTVMTGALRVYTA